MDPVIFAPALDSILSLSSYSKPARKSPFLYKKDRTPPADDDVLNTINTTKLLFEQEFTPQINRLSHLLHERLAKGSIVHQTHEQWLGETKRIISSLTQAITKAKESYKYIPLLTNTYKIAEATSGMLYLEAVSPMVEQKAHTLSRLLASHHHREALQYYKTKVKECESLHKKIAIDEKISDLFAIFKDAKSRLKNVHFELQGKDCAVVAESTALYQEVLLYVQYATSSLQREAQQEVSEHLQARLNELEKLSGSIKKRLSNTLVDILETEESAPLSYIVESRTTLLPSNNYFRSGIYLANYRYRKIWPQIEKLTDVAKAIYRLNTTIHERIKAVCDGELSPAKGLANLENEKDHYFALIEALQKAIYAELAKLGKQPLSKESHAGWYYVAELSTQVKEVRSSIEQFDAIALQKHRFCTLAVSSLVRFLQLANPGIKPDPNFINIESLKRLYEATRAAAKFTIKDVTYSKRAYKVINETLAIVGARMVKLQPFEASVPKKVFSKSHFENSQGELLESYLAKNFLRLLSFTENPADFEFDLVLLTLQESEEHAPLLEELLKTSPYLKELYEAYKCQVAKSYPYQEFLLMRQALFALSRTTESSSTFDILMSFHEAKQLLADLKERPLDEMKDRLIWLERTINTFSRIHDDALKIEDIPGRSLFIPLTNALFTSNLSSGLDAATEITRIIQQDGFVLPPEDSIVGKLFARWKSS